MTKAKSKHSQSRQIIIKLYPKTTDGFPHSGEEVFLESQRFAKLKKSSNLKLFNDKSETNLSILALLRLKRLISEKTYQYEHNRIASIIASDKNHGHSRKLLQFEFGENANDQYFNYMQESNIEALPVLEKYINELETIHPNLCKPLRLLWDKRVQESDLKLLRAMSVRMGFEVLSTENTPKWSDLPEFLELMAIAEMANVQTYTGNILYDQKNPDLDPLFVLSSTKLQQGFVIDRATKALFQLKSKLNLCDEQIQNCILLFNDLMYQTDQGQYIDAFESNLQISLDSINQNEDDFLKLYSKRSFYMSGIHFGNLVKIGATLSGATPAHIHILDLWGKVMSDGLQTVNDLFDFLPFKIKQDGQIHKMYKRELNCPDLWNGKLTYPIFLLLKSCSDSDRDWILSLTKYKAVGKYISESENNRLIKLLFETGTYAKIKKYAGKDVNNLTCE